MFLGERVMGKLARQRCPGCHKPIGLALFTERYLR